MANDALMDELRARYVRRAQAFWLFVQDARFAEWQKTARKSTWSSLDWNWRALGISEEARDAARNLGLVPAEVFAHPLAIEKSPELFKYYRLLACLPEKGLSQLMRGEPDRSMAAKCRLLNGVIGELLPIASELKSDRVLYTMFTEAGTEWQGSWVNDIGKKAADAVETILRDYVVTKKLAAAGAKSSKKRIELKSGTVIHFASEPDVEIRDRDNKLLCVIEIKGSTDSAGAQTRLGETKKSFAKAKAENRHCTTIFLPSMVTSSVEKQLKSEVEVDLVFDLLKIGKDSKARKAFLVELFHHVLRET